MQLHYIDEKIVLMDGTGRPVPTTTRTIARAADARAESNFAECPSCGYGALRLINRYPVRMHESFRGQFKLGTLHAYTRIVTCARCQAFLLRVFRAGHGVSYFSPIAKWTLL